MVYLSVVYPRYEPECPLKNDAVTVEMLWREKKLTLLATQCRGMRSGGEGNYATYEIRAQCIDGLHPKVQTE